ALRPQPNPIRFRLSPKRSLSRNSRADNLKIIERPNPLERADVCYSGACFSSRISSDKIVPLRFKGAATGVIEAKAAVESSCGVGNAYLSESYMKAIADIIRCDAVIKRGVSCVELSEEAIAR